MEPLEAEIFELPVSVRPPSWFPVSGSNVDVGATTIENFDPKNGGIGVEIFFLSRLESEIPLGVILTTPRLSITFVEKVMVWGYEGK